MIVHELVRIGSQAELAAVRHWPSMLDAVIAVITELLLELATGWLSIATEVAIQRGCCGCLLRTGLRRIGIALPDAHRDQRDGEAIKHHHGLQHCAGEVGI